MFVNACVSSDFINMHTPLKTMPLTSTLVFAAIKEERFRFGNGYDQVEDVIGVAQPVRFNSKHVTLF